MLLKPPFKHTAILADPLKEIRESYSRIDFLAYAQRIAEAREGDFPNFVLGKRSWYVCRLIQMAEEPCLRRHVQALNALKLFDQTGRKAVPAPPP